METGPTVLAAWHVAFRRQPSGQLVRVAGFLTMEVAPDGRIERFREWAQYAPGEAG